MALEWPQHFSNYKSIGIFPDTQWQLTPQSEVGPSRNSNSSEYYGCICYSQEDPIKNEVARVATTFNSMGAICCHGHQSSDPTWPKT